jgi:Xaa-Pro dipeptidase
VKKFSSQALSGLNHENRRRKLIEKLAKQDTKIDCALVTSLANLKYFFNYGGASFERFCAGIISVKEGRSALVVPKLDEGKTKSSSVDAVFPWTDSQGYEDALQDSLKKVGGKTKVFGCEDWITLRQMEQVKTVRTQAKFHSVSKIMSDMRVTKDEEEVAALRDSASKLAKGYEKIPNIFREGISEVDAAYEIKKTLSEFDVPDVDFCGIQSGANSAIPHSLTSQKKFSRGDMIVVDISCTNEAGYYADFTRTFCVGKASEEQRRVYDVVKEAQSTGVKAAKPGISAKTIDGDVRSVIQKSGYGDYFIHRTGHGIGLEVHEAPWIKDANSSKLKPGMAFTVEPGIYLPEKFGIRIEDDVVLNETGCENLTPLSHDLIEV